MGEQFGKYELIRRVGVGGMAEIFQAAQHMEDGSKQHVAIKRIFSHLIDEDEIVNMFLDEARLAQSLKHPNIAQIYDMGQVDDHLYIAMEYIHGGDLREVAERGFDAKGFLPIPLAVYAVASAAAGLHFAHNRKDSSGEPLNIVHRDVSPQNILVGMNGAVKMCDFGIAKAERRLSHTQAGQVKGKYAYMSPEQIENADVDARSDVFALGIVLYEITTRTRLFKGESEIETIRKVATLPIEPPTVHRQDIDPALSDIIMRALDRDAKLRYQSAREFQTALVGWLSENSSQTTDSHLAAHMQSLFPELAEEEKKFVEESTKPIMMTPEMFAKLDAGESLEDIAAASDDAPPALDDGEVDDTVIASRTTDEIDMLTEGLGESPAPAVNMDALPLPSMLTEQAPAFDDEPDETAIIPEEEMEAFRADSKAAVDEPQAVEEPEADPTTIMEVPSIEQVPETLQIDAPNIAPAADVATSDPEPAPSAASQSGDIATGPPKKIEPPPRHLTPVPHGGPPKSAEPVTTTHEEPAGHASMDQFSDVDDWKPAKSSKGWIALVVVMVAIAAVVGFVVIALNSESELMKEAEQSQINKKLADEPQETPPLETVAATITTTPEAKIVVNGLLVKGEPQLVKGVDNEVIAYAEGHAPRRAVVPGKQGSPINLALNPLEAEPDSDLQIVSEPRGATVFVNGTQMGATPLTVKLSSRVEHHVWIETPDRYPYAGFISLVPAAENSINTKLEAKDSARKNYVEAKFRAIPRGSLVELDGTPFSATPSYKNLPRNTHSTITFTEPDSRPMTRHIALAEVGTLELRPFLKKAARERGKISVTVPEGLDLYIGSSQYDSEGAKKLELPEGFVKVIIDSPSGRIQSRVEVFPNAHTEYEIKVSGKTAKVHKL